MKTRRLKTRFAPPTTFPVPPAEDALFRAQANSAFDRLQHRLLHDYLAQTTDPQRLQTFRHALRDAAALAAVSGFPTLTFPALAEERVTAADTYLTAQARIWEQSEHFRDEVA